VLLFLRKYKEHQGLKTGYIERNKTMISVYRFIIRLISESNPHPLPWILMYNQNAGKAAVNPDPYDTPLS